MTDDLDDMLGPEPDDLEDLLGEAPRERDELCQAAVEVIAQKERCSAAFVQRALAIGYNRAVTILEQLEEDGYVAPIDGNGRRKVKVKARDAYPKKPTGGANHATASDASVLMVLQRPVSITFLMQVWGRDRQTIVKRLADLEPLGYHRGNQPLYDFRQAAQYLVTPRVRIADHIRKMSAGDLPSSLQKDVWDAKLKEQKWRAQAGELWPTEKVLEVLSDAFQRLKTTTQLWIDNITENHDLSDKARDSLAQHVDALQVDLHRSLVEMPQDSATYSQLGEIEGTELEADC